MSNFVPKHLYDELKKECSEKDTKIGELQTELVS